MGIFAPFSLLYVPNTLIVRGNATATAENIRGAQTLFQFGIFGHLFTIIVFIFVAMVLYRLLNGVNRMQAALMVILVLVSIPLSLVSVLSELAALSLVRGAEYLEVFSRSQLDALALLFLVIRGKAILFAQIFWGLWLIPFGMLVIRSGFIPRVLGILLILNGLAYPVMSLTGLFFPEYASLVDRIAFPALLGELWIMLWLIVKGARFEPVAPRSVV